MLKTLPGGSLANISHLLPALVDSEKIDDHARSGLSTRLTSEPVRVITSPVCRDCLLNVSSSILTKRLCNCACTPCPSAVWIIVAIFGPKLPSTKTAPSTNAKVILFSIAITLTILQAKKE